MQTQTAATEHSNAADPGALGSSASARLGLGLTIVLAVVYFAFVFAVAFAPEFMARPILGNVSFGIVLGILVIVVAVALTGFYVLRANRGAGASGRGVSA